MKSTTSISLNLQLPNYSVAVYAVQGDTMSREIEAALFDGQTPFTPPAGALGTVRYYKPDGTSGFYDTLEDEETVAVTWDDNVATIRLAEQTVTVPGEVLVQLSFYSADAERLSAFTFRLFVEKNPYSDQEFESTDYYSVLTARIADVLNAAIHAPSINELGHWVLWNDETQQYYDSGIDATGPQGETGPRGYAVGSVARTSGTGAAGTTDTYTMYQDDPSQTPVGTFNVYNGLNGNGSVSSVNGKQPDSNGNVTVEADDILLQDGTTSVQDAFDKTVKTTAQTFTPAERKQARENIGIGMPLTGRTILLIGDSYNWGVGATTGQGWGYYFNQQNSVNATIIHQNAGGFAAPGNNNAQYPNETYAGVIDALSASANYDLIIAQAGWNDCTSRNPTGVNGVITGVNSFVSKCRAKWQGVEVIIIPTTNGSPCTEEKVEILRAIYETAYDNSVRSSSMSYEWFFNAGVDASDGAHLTDDGYQLLAKYITRFANGWDGVLDYPKGTSGEVTAGDITITTTSDNFYLYKQTGVVYFMIRFTPNSVASDLLICTLPEAFRPTMRIVVPAVRVWGRSGSEPETLAAIIQTAGTVRVNTSNIAAPSSDYFIQCSYPV